MTLSLKLGLNLAGAMIAAVLLAPGAAVAQAPAGMPPAGKAPITHEALWMMKRVGAPIVSPDGKWVVFSILEPSYEPDKAVSDLWLVPADGSAPPRRITNSKAPKGGASWSPDSRQLAFVSFQP